MKVITKLFFLLVLVGVLQSCSSKKSQEQEKITLENVKDKVETEFNYPIPTSFEITDMLNKANATFVSNITNPAENVDKYETIKDKALNLGVYGTDLSYAITYDKEEETMLYLEASKKLIDGLDIPGAFNAELLAQIEANIENKDSLILIVTKSFYQTYEDLNKSDQAKTSFLIVAASWIESMYITCQLAIESDYDEGLLKVISTQKNAINTLSELASLYQNDEDIQSVAPLLLFMKLNFEGVSTEVELTKGQVQDIVQNITETRNEIVN